MECKRAADEAVLYIVLKKIKYRENPPSTFDITIVFLSLSILACGGGEWCDEASSFTTEKQKTQSPLWSFFHGEVAILCTTRVSYRWQFVYVRIRWSSHGATS
jgi:hypothetical protein